MTYTLKALGEYAIAHYREKSMSTSAPIATRNFEDLREHLYDQFQNPAYDAETGLSPAELETAVDAFLSSNTDMPKVLQKAHVYDIIVTKARICVDPEDWFVDKLAHGGLLRKLTKRWLDEATAGPISDEHETLEQAYRTGLLNGPRAGLDLGHISPGWENMLEGGLENLLAKIDAIRKSELSKDQADFLDAVEIVYNSTIRLAGRFAEMCEHRATTDIDHEERLSTLASVCRRVPAMAPRTFHEALQFTWIMHELIEMEGEFVRSMGQFDRILYPYYMADNDAGRITREQAKELIKFYWIKWYSRTRGARNGKNFVFGGQYPDGSLITNDLTFVALEAYEELNAPDPKLSVRFTPDEDDRLYGRVAELIRDGHNSFVLLNDGVAVKALERMGKTPEDARFYLPIGCYEPAVEGKEAACTMNVTVNLAKVVELALNDGHVPLTGEQVGCRTGDPARFASFDDMWDAYVKQLDFTLDTAHRCIMAAEKQWPDINPSPLIAGTIEDCLETGKDVGQGGPRYNSVGFVGAGLANAADSLMAIRHAVYEEGESTLPLLIDALNRNFQGHEPLRRYLISRVPKWGNGSQVVDKLGRDIAEHYCDRVHGYTNYRGGRCQAALFTLAYAWHGGKKTGALPDGKLSGDSLAPGSGASYGRDREGVTGLLSSVLTLDATKLPNGSVLDVTLHPTAVAGEKGLSSLVDLIKTFFSGGGYALQFNVYDVSTLKDAQKYPEKYATLQVRLTGWSVHFTTLSTFEQDQFIRRISHGTD